MLILTWVGIIFVKILHLANAWCKIMTNIMPTHAKISIEPGIRELFLNSTIAGVVSLLLFFLCGEYRYLYRLIQLVFDSVVS